MKRLLTLLVFLAALTGTTRARAQDTSMNDRYYTKVEIEAIYPGGDTAWIHFLNHTLRYPDDAVNNEIMGKVIVQFIVHRDSTVTDVQAISGPTKGGLREEAVRVVKASGKWAPAKEGGVNVNCYKKLPIIFKLEVAR
ncbi:MAG TPA: energy transducer TonB [Puia sp.]|jgi:protein TonB|nr:energy transducer TonB [Puia sp.]